MTSLVAKILVLFSCWSRYTVTSYPLISQVDSGAEKVCRIRLLMPSTYIFYLAAEVRFSGPL